MHAKIILALAATASAAIMPRQTTGTSDCQADLASLLDTSVPTPPPEVDLSSLDPNDPCKFTPPASASSAWNSYAEEAKSWVKENEDLFKKLTKDCSMGSNGFNIPDLSSCKAASSGDSDKDTGSKDSSKDKDGAAAINGPAAMGGLLVAGAAAVLAL